MKTFNTYSLPDLIDRANVLLDCTLRIGDDVMPARCEPHETRFASYVRVKTATTSVLVPAAIARKVILEKGAHFCARN